MARINDTTLRDWNNGETMREADYEQERSLIQTAINDNYDRLIKNYYVINNSGVTKTTQSLDKAINYLKFKESSTIVLTLDNTTSTLQIAVIDGSITTSKLTDLGVTNAKLADGSVSTIKLQNSSVTREKVANGAINLQKLDLASLDSRYYTESEIDANYYTKTELDGYLRDGDTVIKYEVFTITSSNNDDGTFTYQDANGNDIVGTLTAEGYQTFELQLGHFVVGENRIEATINDTLTRSVASGGLREETETSVTLTVPEGNGAEITFKYFERIGLMGEHALSHENGGADEIKGLLNISTTEPSQKFVGKIWGKVI